MLELRGGGPALLDEPVRLSAHGGGAALRWRARLTDDDGLVWRTEAAVPAELGGRWTGKADRAALDSLRPVQLEVHVETETAAASRTLTRALVADGVVVRRWKDLGARMLRPAGPPRATVLAEGSLPAAALLASRGALVVVGGEDALERLAAVPGAGEPQRLTLPSPPGAPAREPADGEAWDALLAELGLEPRAAG